MNAILKYLSFPQIAFLYILFLSASCETAKPQVTEKVPVMYKVFIPDTVFIGAKREVKSLPQYFSEHKNTEVKNICFMLDEGDYTSEKELWVRGENLIVEGNGKVNLYCSTLYNNVMWVMGDNIVIKNLRMKHLIPGDPAGQNCSGRVLAFDNASNIFVENCDLNGCGLAGLHDNLGNSNILIRNCYIHNNSLGAYTDINGGVWLKEVNDHPVFKFENNRMVNNGPDRIIESDSATYWVNQKYLDCINTGTSVCKCQEENSFLILSADTITKRITIIPAIQYSWETLSADLSFSKPDIYLLSPEYEIDTNTVLSLKGNKLMLKSPKHTMVFTKVIVKRLEEGDEFDMRRQIGIMNCRPLLKYTISSENGSQVLLTQEELTGYIAEGQVSISCSDDYYYTELYIRSTKTEFFVVYEKDQIKLYKEIESRSRGEKVDVSKLKQYQIYNKK